MSSAYVNVRGSLNPVVLENAVLHIHIVEGVISICPAGSGSDGSVEGIDLLDFGRSGVGIVKGITVNGINEGLLRTAVFNAAVYRLELNAIGINGDSHRLNDLGVCFTERAVIEARRTHK